MLPLYLHVNQKSDDDDDVPARYHSKRCHTSIIRHRSIVLQYLAHKLGLEAVTYWIEGYPESPNPRFSKEVILDGIQLLFGNNIFSFDDNFFRQEKGMAMGTKSASVYATLTIGYLEEKLYTIIETDYNTEFQQYLKMYWKRFLDDCFVPWTQSEEELFHFKQSK